MEGFVVAFGVVVEGVLDVFGNVLEAIFVKLLVFCLFHSVFEVVDYTVGVVENLVPVVSRSAEIFIGFVGEVSEVQDPFFSQAAAVEPVMLVEVDIGYSEQVENIEVVNRVELDFDGGLNQSQPCGVNGSVSVV